MNKTRQGRLVRMRIELGLWSTPMMWVGLFGHCSTGLAQGIPQIRAEEELAGTRIQLAEPVRRRVQQEAEKLYTNRPLVVAKLDQLILYFPIIEPLLAQYGLPDDFKFLALQDSLLLEHPASRGLWGIPKTSLPGLRVDSIVDERLHLLKSTATVAERLKLLRAQYPDWVSVLHAYGRLIRSDSATTALPEHTPSATSYLLNRPSERLLIQLLASKAVLERSLAVYHPQRQTTLFPVEVVNVSTLQELVAYFKVSEQELMRYNAWLKAEGVPASPDLPYIVFIPTPLEQYAEIRRRAQFLGEKADTPPDVGFPMLQKRTAKSNEREAILYRINGKKGIQARLYDNPITLAYAGHVKMAKFLRYNDLLARQPVFAGMIYYLEKKAKRAKVPFHIVRRGQSLWDVSQQYGLLLRSLSDYNRLSPDQQPAVGQILWLQKKRPASTPIEYYRPPEPPATTPPVIANQETPLVSAKLAPVRVAAANESEEAPALNSPLDPEGQQEVSRYSGATKMIRPGNKTEEPEKSGADLVEPAEAVEPLLMHTVEKGDTYASIAGRYNVTRQQIFLWNNLSVWKPLRTGQLVVIDKARKMVQSRSTPSVKASLQRVVVRRAISNPAGPAKLPAAKSPKPVVADWSDLIHVVKPGENLYRIGLRYNVKPTQIQQWNRLPDLTAVVGARLVIRK